MFAHLFKVSPVRGLCCSVGGFIGTHMVDRYKHKKALVNQADLTPAETIALTQYQQKIVKFNDGDTNVPHVKYTTLKDVDVAAFTANTNEILIKRGTGDINDFVLAHEFAHWRLGHGPNIDNIAINVVGVGLVLALPLPMMAAFIAFGAWTAHITNQSQTTSFKENEADKHAILLGYAKEGFEFFSKHPDNPTDDTHPLNSLRSAHCLVAMRSN
jgi:hypothetical protein